MCQYSGPQGMTRKQTQGIQDHIRNLEAQVKQLSATSFGKNQLQKPNIGENNRSIPNSGLIQPGPSEGIAQTEEDAAFPGILVQQDGTQYINPTHWQAVLDEVCHRCNHLSSTAPWLIQQTDRGGEGISSINRRIIT